MAKLLFGVLGRVSCVAALALLSAAPPPQSTPAPPDAAPERLAELKSAAARYGDAANGLVYDAHTAAAACARLPAPSAPMTPERRTQLQAARRACDAFRDQLRTVRADQVRCVLALKPEALAGLACTHVTDLQLHVTLDMAAFDEVSKLLSARGPDRQTAFGKAAGILKDMSSGDRASRRKATLKAIAALKPRAVKDPPTSKEKPEASRARAACDAGAQGAHAPQPPPDPSRG